MFVMFASFQFVKMILLLNDKLNCSKRCTDSLCDFGG